MNRRLVRDRLLLHAIGEAYRNIVPPGVFPVVLLFLDLPYQEVDVNVHPAKIEVRFRHPQFVHDFTRDALRHALSLARPIPGFPAARAAAAAAGAASSQPGAPANGAGASSVSGALGPETFATPGALPGPPRAVIPTSFGSRRRPIAEAFELTGAPDRPIPQRFSLRIGRRDELSASRGGCRRRASAVVRGAAGACAAASAEAESPGALPAPGKFST